MRVIVMNEGDYNKKWLPVRNKYRMAIVCVLIIAPIVNVLAFNFTGLLSRDALFGVVGLSIILGGNLFAFLYDKSYSAGPGSYPADGSTGRSILAVIFLVGYVFAQFLPLIL